MPEMKKSKHIPACVLILVFLFSGHSGSYMLGQQKEDRSHYENLIISAVEKYDAQDFAGASGILGKVVAEDPENDAAHYYLGLSAFCQKDFSLAEKELKAAVQIDSMNFWYRYRLALVYSATDRKELTIAMYEDLLRDFPKKNDLYYNLIDLYLSDGQSERALETLSQIETVSGKNEATAMTRFQLLARLGKQKEAYESLEEFNREYSSPQVLSMLGDWQMSMYNDSTALAYYDEALDIAPGFAPAMLGKAETFRMTRRYDEYFSILDAFVQDKDVPAEGKYEYLKALIQHSDPNFLSTFRQSLDSVMTDCLAAYPGDSSAVALAGIYYYGTGRQDKAKEYFRKNVDAWPESIGAAANYAEALMYMGDWKELSSYSREAYDRFPDELAFLEMSTLADYNLGAYNDVLATCSRIVSVAPDDSARVLTAYTTMGDMYYHLGEAKKAYRSYDAALRINPGYLPVLNNYAYFLSLDGKRLKKAYAMSKVTVEKEPDNPTYLDTFGWILYLQGKAAEAKPYFKHAMLYGGKDSAVTLDHYAEVLFDLKEYSLAFVYWNQALAKDKDGEIEGLEQKIKQRKSEMNREKK